MDEKLAKLKKKIEAKEKEKIELEGRMSQILSDLKAKFDIETIEDAKSLLKEKQEEHKSKSRKLQKRIEDFEEEFADLL